MSEWFWTKVWCFAESRGLSFGRFAPFVFGKAIGRKGVRVYDDE